MKMTRNRKNAVNVVMLMAMVFLPALLPGCKSQEAKKQQEVAEKVETISQQAQKMTDQDLQKKVYEIQMKKGTNPANMTPEESALIGQAAIRGLL